MPICAAFVSGKCRGQCPNLHVDIKQAIATTIKASLTGKQWLLSTFAPFEGDSDLPNYIEDLSFEEVRSDFYAARATGSEHLAKQRFQQQWAQAHEMSMKMANPDHNVAKYLVDTFGLEGQKNKPKPSSLLAPPNPFGQVANPTPASGGSIFGGGSSNPTPLGSGSIFGASATPAATGGSIFGASATPAATGGSIFGGSTAPAASGGSIFGGGAPAMAPQSGGSIFGGGAATATSGGSIFGGQPQQPQMNQAPGGNIFAQQSQAAAAQTNIFAQPQPAPPQPQATGSIFAQANQNLPTSAPVGGNIFAQSPFGGGGNVPQPAQPANVFQQAAATMATPSPFQQQQPVGGAPPQGNIFGNVAQNASQAAQTSVFGQTTQPPQQPVNLSSNTNVFAGSPFGGGASASIPASIPQATIQVSGDALMYSTVEELTPDDLEIYRSDAPFELGKIPNLPPPREVC